MFDGLVDMIQPLHNKFARGVKIKVTGDLKLGDSPVRRGGFERALSMFFFKGIDMLKIAIIFHQQHSINNSVY